MKEILDAETYLSRMKNQKVNYHKVLRRMIKDWEANNERPKVLLHSCCAPCSTSSLEFLAEHADVTIFFSQGTQ
ncbi:epoxyqueuosine reductase QueH [Paenibacillus chitinolyticus]|uniref:epoxyqueuosine reductase QueH n=1 Tax=Paenibacillus chitinolyticus TaxID=79263 RepID=UPI003D0439AA